MAQAENLDEIQVKELRECIALTMAKNNSLASLPDDCATIGLPPMDIKINSKPWNMRYRLQDLNKSELLEIAQKVLGLYPNANLSDAYIEITQNNVHRISEITRRDVLAVLDNLDELFGEIDLYEGLSTLVPENEEPESNHDPYFKLKNDIEQHYRRNSDYSHGDALIKYGALTCSQTRFISLIEKLLHPLVRREQEQLDLAEDINDILIRDGFTVSVSDEESGYPVYKVHRITPGVEGVPKNIIFASINTKPDIYFSDAINNNVCVRNKTDALIYDRFLTNSGLLWDALVDWWNAQEENINNVQNQRTLYNRLKLSVGKSGSLGEYALFTSYYLIFRKELKCKLPALIPQVYLHYDPRTIKQRGGTPLLPRQRMDFLLLLDNVRIVIEVDGKQHYANGDKASPEKYAEMIAEDRRLRLSGYELYRFGGYEFIDTERMGDKIKIGSESNRLAEKFFRQLFEKHNVIN